MIIYLYVIIIFVNSVFVIVLHVFVHISLNQRYTSLLKKAKLESYKKQLTVAFISGFYGMIFFAFYALGIWYVN